MHVGLLLAMMSAFALPVISN